MPIGVGLEKLKAYLEDNKARHVQRIQKAVQQPSVSTEDLGVRECADLLVEFHRLRQSRCYRSRFGHRNAARHDQSLAAAAHS